MGRNIVQSPLVENLLRLPLAFHRKRFFLAITLCSLWSAMLWIRVTLEPDRYITVDGKYYQELAQNWLQGKKMVLRGIQNAKGSPFSPYPPGFPVFLGMTQHFSGLPFPLAVVLLHSIFVFAIFFLGSGQLSWPALVVVFFSDTAFDLAGNVWSEFSFVFLLILGGLWLKYKTGKGKRGGFLDGIIAGVFFTGAFFMRYIAVFLIPWLLWSCLNSSKKSKQSYGTAGAIFLFLAVSWFLVQYLETGLITGGDRYPNIESNALLFRDVTKGILNQLLVFRDWQGTKPWWVSLGAIIQIFFLVFFFSIKGRWQVVFQHTFFRMGVCFLLVMIPIRWYFYFAEGFDFRLLGPGFLLLGLGILDGNFKSEKWVDARVFVAAWLVASCIFLLPKGQLFSVFDLAVPIFFQRLSLFLT